MAYGAPLYGGSLGTSSAGHLYGGSLGTTVSVVEGEFTGPVYAIPKDVENFLILNGFLDSNSDVISGVLENYIMEAENEFEQRSGTAYKPVTVQDEVHDLEAVRQRYNEFMERDWIAVPRPIHLDHRPILPFDSNLDKIELYEGHETEATASDPIRRWTRWDQKSYGRNNDFWFDVEKGILFVRKVFLFRRASAVRITYRYGKTITKTTAEIQRDSTSLPVESTWNYQHRGIIRVGSEYMMHPRKTETGFSPLIRGMFGTTPQYHPAGSEVYEVPDNVRQGITKRAAMHYLQNEVFNSNVADAGGSGPTSDARIKAWEKDWEQLIGGTYQKWSLM